MKKAPAKPSTLAQFLVALTALYPHDKTAPGLVIAWLPDKQQFYASAKRYDGPLDQGKHDIVTTYGNTIEEAIYNLASTWLDSIIPVAQFVQSIHKY